MCYQCILIEGTRGQEFHLMKATGRRKTHLEGPTDFAISIRFILVSQCSVLED